MLSCQADLNGRYYITPFVAGILFLVMSGGNCASEVQARRFGTGIVLPKAPRMADVKHAELTTALLRPRDMTSIRGGELAMDNSGTDEDEMEGNDGDDERNEITQHPDYEKMQSYRMSQQILMQLRATFLSEALASRGLPITTLVDVATPDGEQPPQPVDWDCAMSTKEEPKSCLYSFDAEIGTKVMKPIDTEQWISVSALNRLRRTDPSKVEPMWHSKYAILKSWFDPDSEFSILQHVGVQGFVLHFVLQNSRLHLVLGLSLFVASIVCMPILEYLVNRILVSPLVWGTWHQWARFLHAALPLKLLMGQMLFKGVASLFLYLVSIVKSRLVELECQILEQRIPLTVGPGSETFPDDEDEELELSDVGDYEDDGDDIDLDSSDDDQSDDFEED